MSEENNATSKKATEDKDKTINTLIEQNNKLIERFNEMQEQLKSVYQDKYFKGKTEEKQDDFDTYCCNRFDYANKINKKGE